MDPTSEPKTETTTPSEDRPAHAAAPSSGDELSPELHAEIEAAMQDLDAMEQSGEKPSRAIRGPRVVQAGREHREGVVVSVGPTDVFVEFGPKELGVVEKTQFASEEDVPKVGSQLKVVVNRFNADESIYLCSLPGAVQKADWELLETGQVVEATVKSVTKGGLELEIAQHRAFMPASQVSIDHIPDLSVFIGEKLTCQISRIDRRGRGNIVLSRRDLLEEERKEQASKLRETLAEGQVIEGTVRKIMPFGAFVDLGGVDGLIHISDLSYDRVGYGEKAVAKLLSEGQAVKVQVLKLDWEGNRISLGLKQMQDDPFQSAVSDLVEGADVSGKVTNIADFGAFVELGPGVEGLIHISEIDYKRVESVGDVLKEGEVVQVRVLKVDPETRRISLSRKALLPEPERPAGAPRGKGKGKGGRGDRDNRSAEEILKDSPALRRMREKFGNQGFKGGLG